jgi:hypothetical protein
LQKTNISFVMTVRPCIRVEQLYSHWKNFNEIDTWAFFENMPRKFKVRQNRTRTAGTLDEDQDTALSYFAQFFLEWENFQEKL